jgi:opacity protein-like surface antigen
MKKCVLAFSCVLLTTFVQAQKWEYGIDINVMQPVGGMERTMDNAVGANIFLAYNLKAPFAIGIELGYNNYGSQTTRQEYVFDDGTRTETDVVVNNNITSLNFSGKYFLRNSKKFNPYVTGRLGWSRFSTNLYIEDPQDETGCEPLESDVLYRDGTFTASAGAGIRLDMSAVFKRLTTNKFFFDFGVQSVRGGTVGYMNVDIDPSKPAPTKDVMAKFINTKTMVVHEHHVGYVYTGLVDMLQYRVGIVIRPNFDLIRYEQ